MKKSLLLIILFSLNLYAEKFNPDYLYGKHKTPINLFGGKTSEELNTSIETVSPEELNQIRYYSVYDILKQRFTDLKEYSVFINGNFIGNNTDILKNMPNSVIGRIEVSDKNHTASNSIQKRKSINIITQGSCGNNSIHSVYFSNGKSLTSANANYTSGLLEVNFNAAVSADKEMSNTKNSFNGTKKNSADAIVSSAKYIHSDKIQSSFNLSYFDQKNNSNITMNSSYSLLFEPNPFIEAKGILYMLNQTDGDITDKSKSSKAVIIFNLTPDFTTEISAGFGRSDFRENHETAKLNFHNSFAGIYYTKEHFEFNSYFSAKGYTSENVFFSGNTDIALKLLNKSIKLFTGISGESSNGLKEIISDKVLFDNPVTETSIYTGFQITYYDYFYLKNILTKIYTNEERNKFDVKGKSHYEITNNASLNLRLISLGINHIQKINSGKKTGDFFATVSGPGKMQPYFSASVKLSGKTTDDCIAGAEVSIPVYDLRIEAGITDILNKEDGTGNRELSAGICYYF
ncbi:MAG TPA: hypothetical protein PK624_10105 [Spirochaetota bacterium]|nr:hypothetical protein [Spirochaetota bacterium]HOR45135.1 hypothetical protein [Spirochaetota bacterium]HOU84168.1 hypothetical protein [Spirochaetota bacterium]HPK56749.1 hypothetical protein [Spirochaetota bacterium]HQE59140.1 hypothetical protein [Spirochaetota bacterium]